MDVEGSNPFSRSAGFRRRLRHLAISSFPGGAAFSRPITHAITQGWIELDDGRDCRLLVDSDGGSFKVLQFRVRG